MTASVSHLEQSGRIADNVGELEDVGSELLLHVTQEENCVLGGKPADVCHCKSNVTEKNMLCSEDTRIDGTCFFFIIIK